jgi:hypothetical protein
MRDEKSTASIIGQSSRQKPTGNHMRSIGIKSSGIPQRRGVGSTKKRRARFGKVGTFDRVIGIAQLIIAIPVILITALVVDFRRY